jgi:large subunit ribosomal protein L17
MNTVLKKLFNDLGVRFMDRPGGYTRILKRMQRRLGDAGETAIIELVGNVETTTAVAPAPVAPIVEK